MVCCYCLLDGGVDIILQYYSSTNIILGGVTKQKRFFFFKIVLQKTDSDYKDKIIININYQNNLNMQT